jgi:Cu(I)/Ag(I) efflux system membrane fusion protein
MNAPRSRVLAATLALVAVAAVSGAAGYRWALRDAPQGTPAPAAGSGTPVAVPGERPVLYWYDPMVPNQHFDKPGKSPFMDMQLVPQYAEDTHVAGGLHIDPTITQNIGMRLATAERAVPSSAIAAPVSVQLNDRLVAVVAARANGFVERTWPHAPGDVVSAGAPLAEVLLPEWAGAQTEFLAVLHTGDAALVEAARARLQLLGMAPALVDRVAASGHVEATQVLTAPIAGVVATLDVRPGMTVTAGASLARINGLGSVWLEAAVPATQAAAIGPGTQLVAQFPAWPELRFRAPVQTVLTSIDPESRTLRVRAEIGSQGGKLRPGMVGEAQLIARDRTAQLMIPAEALIRTGTRSLVIRALPGGHFQPVEVTAGADAQGRVVVLKGLQEGDRVVASGQFLIDSDASLKGLLTRLDPGGAAP